MFIHFTALIVKCDRCGESYDDWRSLEYWFRNEQEATETVIDDGWAEIDGKLYCPNCYGNNEDTDEYEVRK